jgi:hypothetical protein
MIQAQLKEVGVNYPQANETIEPGHYSFKVTAAEDAKEVRLSIDDGAWQPCRYDNGFWWYDCQNEAPGTHVAVTRVIQADGSLILGQPRLFNVKSR